MRKNNIARDRVSVDGSPFGLGLPISLAGIEDIFVFLYALAKQCEFFFHIPPKKFFLLEMSKSASVACCKMLPFGCDRTDLQLLGAVRVVEAV